MKLRIRNIFIGKKGIRCGWLLLSAAVLYMIATNGVHYLYWSVYNVLMSVWGVTSANIVRAPAAVQFLYRWSNIIAQLLQSVLLIASAVLLRRMARIDCGKGTLQSIAVGAGFGAAAMIGIWSVLMLIGCVRLGWRITQPAFSVNTAALLLTVSAAAIGECSFLYSALYRGIRKMQSMWIAAVGIALLRMLLQGVFSPMLMLNYALFALVCCLLTEKKGIGAAAAFCFAWRFLEQAVFGVCGYPAALYETYPVNLYWLGGGNSGIMAGAMTSIVLISVCILLMTPFKKVTNKF